MPCFRSRPGKPAGGQLLILAAALVTFGCERTGAMHDLAGTTMGTVWHVRWVDPEGNSNPAAVEKAIQLRLDELERRLSHWDPDSELSRLNAAEPGAWVSVSHDVIVVIAGAESVRTATGGAFDARIGEIVNRWGFGPDEAPASPPGATELSRILESIADGGVEIDESKSAVRRLDQHTRFDLSAIAKGYAADQVSVLLTSMALSNHTVEIGGEVRVSGLRHPGRNWRIGVQSPGAGIDGVHVVSIQDGGIATSGDYVNVVELGDREFAHTLDPRTGRPAGSGLVAVTVVAGSAMQADALATAMMVMAPEAATDYCETEGIAALMAMAGTHDTLVYQACSAMCESLAQGSSAQCDNGVL